MRKAVWLIALAGCAQVLDADDYGRSTRGTLEECGGLAYPNDACGACMQGCCTEAAACAADGACSAVESCFADCKPDDVACFGTCSSSVPYNTRAERRLERCLATRCGEACSIGCGRMMSPTRAACFRQQSECCDIEQRVWRDDAASAWLDCQTHCHPSVTEPVADADACGCVAQNPGSGPLASAMVACQRACSDVEPDWSCVGKVQWPANLDGNPLRYELRVTDVPAGAPLPGVRVTLCTGIDPGCAAPIQPPVENDAEGKVVLSLAPRFGSSPPDYFGYMLFQGDDVVDTPYFWLPPPRQSAVSTRAVVSPLLRTLLYAGTGITLDPSRGAVGVAVTDCNYLGMAEGILLESDPPGEPAYTRNGVTMSGEIGTDASGFGAIVNLPPGVVKLRARQIGTDRVVAETDVVVRANGYTIVLLPPTP